MRSAGAVYRKLKEVRFKHWIIFYRQHSKRTSENCFYNKIFPLQDSEGKTYLIKLCFLHQGGPKEIQPHLFEICDNEHECKNCNAFVNKFSKEEIKKLYVEELNTKKIKEMKYPDICALEWMLERSVVELPLLHNIQVLYYKIKSFILRNKIL